MEWDRTAHRASWGVKRRDALYLAGLAAGLALAVGSRVFLSHADLDDAAVVALQVGVIVALTGSSIAILVRLLRRRRPSLPLAASIASAGFGLVAVGYVTTGYVDLSVSLHALLSPRDASRTSVVLGPGGHDVRLTGEIGEGTAQRLSSLLAAHPAVTRIHLTSEGGLVDEGEALRRVIAAHGMTTFVPDYCVSACTLAFLGGRERIVMNEARLGFHAPFEEGVLGQTFPGDDGTERGIYIAAGVAPDFVDKALSVAPSDIWTPDVARLLSAHVATAAVDRYRFPDSSLDGAATLAGARDMLLHNFALTQVLQQWHPDAVDSIAGWYLNAYREGLSEGRIVEGLTSIVGATVSTVMAEADDDTLFGLGRFLDAAMRSAKSDEDCAALGAKADLLRGEVVLDREAVRGDGAEGDDPKVDDAAKGRADDVAVALLKRALRSRRPAFVGRSAGPREAERILSRKAGACAATRDLYATILRLSHRDAAATIRILSMRPAPDLPAAISIADRVH